jgi:methionyl aminopeptidase
MTPQGRPLVAVGRVSPGLSVPPEIARPDYALFGKPKRRFFSRGDSNPLTPDLLLRMRRACKAAAEVLDIAGKAVRPGITTEALDALAHREIIARGAYPSPLNYNGFPKSICTSVNEVVCHGIPDTRSLEEGDIVNIDITVFLDGMHGDCSATFPVGKISSAAQALIDVTRDCLDRGIAAVVPGRPISDIGRAIEALATQHRYGVVRAYCGHGIGESFHTGIYVPHFFDRSAKTIMRPGMTFTIEPMITIGSYECVQWPDGWTEVTTDRDLTAQFEHTIVVTDTGAEILTVV